MSNEPRDDDRALEEFLRRRDPLSGRYREAAAEQPSAAIDDAILAASRRAAAARPQDAGSRPRALCRNWTSRWSAPLAAAAVVVLAVALTVLLEREPEVMDFGDSSRQQQDLSAPPPASAPAQPEESRKSAPPAIAPAPPKRVEPALALREKKEAPTDDSAAQFAPQPAAESEAASGMVADRMAAEPAQSKVLARPDSAPAAAASRAIRGDTLEATELAHAPAAKERLSEIEALYDQVRTDAADRALTSFCRDFPGYRLPERLMKEARRLTTDCAQ